MPDADCELNFHQSPLHSDQLAHNPIMSTDPLSHSIITFIHNENSLARMLHFILVLLHQSSTQINSLIVPNKTYCFLNLGATKSFPEGLSSGIPSSTFTCCTESITLLPIKISNTCSHSLPFSFGSSLSPGKIKKIYKHNRHKHMNMEHKFYNISNTMYLHCLSNNFLIDLNISVIPDVSDPSY